MIDRDATPPADGGRSEVRSGAAATLGRGAADIDAALLLTALRAFRRGDFTVRLPEDEEGVGGKIYDTLNEIIETKQQLTLEFQRLSRVVTEEGRISERVAMTDPGGGWGESIRAVNGLLAGYAIPTTEVARVVSAISRGDLTHTMPLELDGRPLKGEFHQIARTVNATVERLRQFADQVTRVAREVGTEGELGGQAEVHGVAGTWKELTDSVNTMARNLTAQVRNIAEVATAVAQGDLTRKITVDARGEISQLKETINTMVEQLRTFANEVTRLAHEVGSEGALGGQAQVKGVAGTWKELTDNVNTMARNLTHQVRDVARVATAVALGDLSQKVEVEARGEIRELKSTVNTMVDQLSTFADEVTRVAREVGTEGKLGGQAAVPGVAGTWKHLTDNVNTMASNLTDQVRNIAAVSTAVAHGDLTKKIEVEAQGEILELKSTINTMVDQLSTFAAEVTRVAREVGIEGELGGQAIVPEVAGTWKDLTDNVNTMASNLTNQVRDIAAVATAVARGDLTQNITVEVRGELAELKDTINTMVDQLSTFAAEVTRVAREVGTEGKLGGQAEVAGVAGIWKDLTDNVNTMATNLTDQVRNIAAVSTAVARGDLSKKVTVEVQGETLELKNTINTMVDQLSTFAAEVTRVAREVGFEGRLGGQAVVPGVAGTWKDLTDNVNTMATNLTDQVRNIAAVSTAVAEGDLTKKITVAVQGEILELKNTINTMVDQLRVFAAEVTRVAREVGTEGKLGVQADVRGVSGVWEELTNNVNTMAGNLTDQVRDIAQVTTAVARGDLTRKIAVEVRGEMLQLKNTINTMVDQLSTFGEEVTRVAREVGSEGKLGGQAEVQGAFGLWKELTENVNTMARNLTNQVRDVAQVATAVAQGDLTKKITVEARGEILQLKNTVNTMVDQLGEFGDEVSRLAREVGTEGELGGQAHVKGVRGLWKELTENVNTMARNLTSQVRDIAQVATAVAEGDLTRQITVDARGEFLDVKRTVNTMVDQLSTFADEVTRLAREVGTDGKLGGQAQIRGVSGTWKDLTDNVNTMASNLTSQVRGIARVVTAISKGDLTQKLTLEAGGEIAELSETINTMTVTLSTFAEQVSAVAREVGIEGRLGGQARVPGAAGTWRDLTDNVNELAGNLTTQVRAIGEVATAVTRGDLTRTITVVAAGEVAQLKDTINQMIAALKETTEKNEAQNWLNAGLAKFSRLLQGQRDLVTVARTILSELAPLVQSQHGVFYVADELDGRVDRLWLLASYGFKARKGVSSEFALCEGLVGQCAFEKERILLGKVPSDYVVINSGLGEAAPLQVVVLPILFQDQVKAVIELASFEPFDELKLAFLDQLVETVGIVLSTIQATMRTEELLKESQALSAELRSQQDELQQTNAELEEKATLLARQKREVEQKSREVELARAALEEKAEQLAVTSRYKSEFLANMSHELRTPLNSLLILSQLLAANAEGNLSGKQVEQAQTITAAAHDLLGLISDILDLSRIEAGKMSVELRTVVLPELLEQLERGLGQLARDKGLELEFSLDRGAPRQLRTDPKRLQQVLKNLLSNAIKFTEHGSVGLAVLPVTGGWRSDRAELDAAELVLAFRVEDTGIGIPREDQERIFEAFQQAEGGIDRRYGGTGLGLAISREIAALLGGDLTVQSDPGRGSVFTLFLPIAPPRRAEEERRWERPRSEPLSRTRSHREGDPWLLDDRGALTLPGAREQPVVLVVEDDPAFAQILADQCRERGQQVLLAPTGSEAIDLARLHRPSAITLDLLLPDSSGWQVLDRIKHDPDLRHIPVQIISVESLEDAAARGLVAGASAVLQKPADREALGTAMDALARRLARRGARLLLVAAASEARGEVEGLLAGLDVEVLCVPDPAAGAASETVDAVVLDLGPEGGSPLGALARLRERGQAAPAIICAGQELSLEERAAARRRAAVVVPRGEPGAARLLERLTLYLHLPLAELGPAREELLRRAAREDPTLIGRKVLVVDDDVRNVYALTSVLEPQGVLVRFAEDGAQALRCLDAEPDTDLVVMDVMMPGMDGLEATRRIRAQERFARLPVLALTAKALRGDREACLEAGASDYVTKPVDPGQLLSAIRVLLPRD
ncbi:MAG: HAMP domain-containing protein [Planctomycetota bacterium]